MILVVVGMSAPLIYACLKCGTTTGYIGGCTCPGLPACSSTYDTVRCYWNDDRIRVDCNCTDPNNYGCIFTPTCGTDDGCLEGG